MNLPDKALYVQSPRVEIRDLVSKTGSIQAKFLCLNRVENS